MPQLSPANGLNMFMLLFIIFMMILFLVQFKFQVISYSFFTTDIIKKKNSSLFYY